MENSLKKIHLSADIIKLIAAFLMLADHAAFGLLHLFLSVKYMDILPQTYTKLNNIYTVLRGVGRLAFPIFCFFLVEGFMKTHSLRKYLLRLLAFALISELPFDYALYRKWNPDHQNVILTLFIGALMLVLIRYIEERIPGMTDGLKWLLIFCVIAAACEAAALLKTDYSYNGILIIAVLYLTRSIRSLQLLSGAVFSSFEKNAPVAFILLYFYDPSVKPKLKYFFYLFYPLHLLLIYLIGFSVYQ